MLIAGVRVDGFNGMYENFLLIKSETQRARTLPNCRRVRVCLPRVCCWQLAESPFDPVSSLALCVLLFGNSWRGAAAPVRHLRPFSVRSHARAPSAHHRRRRGRKLPHIALVLVRMDGWCGWWQKDIFRSVLLVDSLSIL